MSDHIRLRKSLQKPLQAPVWTHGFTLAPLSAVKPRAIHQVLVDAYANGFGDVAEFDAWWTSLVEDTEFDPTLVLAVIASGEPVAVAQCWTSAFIKDLVVAPAHRRNGLGTALLWSIFAIFKARGAAHLDLKVRSANAPARRLYAGVGMVEAPL